MLTISLLSLLQSITLTPIIFIPHTTPPPSQALTLKVPFDLAQLWAVRSTDFSDFLTIFTQTGMCFHLSYCLILFSYSLLLSILTHIFSFTPCFLCLHHFVHFIYCIYPLFFYARNFFNVDSIFFFLTTSFTFFFIIGNSALCLTCLSHYGILKAINVSLNGGQKFSLPPPPEDL